MRIKKFRPGGRAEASGVLKVGMVLLSVDPDGKPTSRLDMRQEHLGDVTPALMGASGSAIRLRVAPQHLFPAAGPQ